jgi:N-acetylmuramoyl-L-alanine amidase
MTRYKDYHVSLRGRIKKANKAKADLFVSIHANSTPNKSRVYKAYGLETYFLQTTRNARAKRVAAKENADLLKSMDSTTKQVLLNTVFTGPKIQLSNRLAIDVHRAVLNSLRAKYKGVKDNGVRGAPFYVLVGAEMPAILIEVGYLSNPKERKRLYNRDYQERIAKGIVEGIVNYLRIRERELE